MLVTSDLWGPPGKDVLMIYEGNAWKKHEIAPGITG